LRASHLTTEGDEWASDDDERAWVAGSVTPTSKKLVPAASKSAPSMISSSTAAGSHQEMALFQLDFSCSKFALVAAQISADHNVPMRRAASKSASMLSPATCRSCDRSFASASALSLHTMDVHDEAQHAMSCTACSLCFVTRSERDQHMMLVHDAPQVVVEFLRSSSNSEDSDPRRVGKVTREEFLLVLGLKALPVAEQDASDDDDVSPQKAGTKAADVDANQNLLKTTAAADVPVPPVPAALNLTAGGPLVVGPLMALPAPVSPMLPGAVPSGVLPQNLSPLVSSQPVVTPASAFRFIANSSAMTLLSTNANSIQSITAMTGSFPFLSPFMPAASNAMKNYSRDANLSASGGSVSSDGGTKSGSGSDVEDSNRTSMCC